MAQSFEYTYEGKTLVYWIVSETDKTCTVVKDWDRTIDGDLVIPSVANDGTADYSVIAIDKGAFDGCEGLTSVIIPNSVVKIDDIAFQRCSGLETIEIPTSVTTLGNSVFNQCTGLSYVKIPSSVSSIGYQLFSNCTGLISVELPSSITSMGHSVFRFCTNLKSIVIPDCISILPMQTFIYCSKLSSVTFGSSMIAIRDRAFMGCEALESIVLPKSISNIGLSVFSNCSGLKSVELSEELSYIGENAFSECKSLSNIVCKGKTPSNADTNVFDEDVYENASLFVPAGCVESYQSVSPWSLFKKISVKDTSGVEKINELEYETSSESSWHVYDLNGRDISDSIENLSEGIYVVREGTKLRKILVK